MCWLFFWNTGEANLARGEGRLCEIQRVAGAGHVGQAGWSVLPGNRSGDSSGN